MWMLWALLAVSDATVADLAKRFDTELECAKPEDTRKVGTRVHRYWCPMAALPKATFAAPKARRTLLGVAIALRKGTAVVDAILGSTDLAVLAVGPEGALVTSLTPSDEKEKQELGRVVFSLGLVLKGKAQAVEIPADLAGFLKSFDAKPLHPVKAGAYEAKLPSRIYSVKGSFGEGFVVIEQAPEGARVNLFPVAPQTVAK
jgi:hypothetical protein